MIFLTWILLCLNTHFTLASQCNLIAYKLNCTCEPEKYPERRDFNVHCLEDKVNIIFDSTRNYLQVKCLDAITINDTLFSKFISQEQTVENIKFEGCTLPDTTFPKLLYDLNFKQLIIKCQGRREANTNWSSVMLQKLNYMEELLIQGCPTDTVPEDLFSINPSLKKLYLEENYFTSLPSKLLYNITKLQMLSLMNNALVNISDDFFLNSETIEELVLKKNQLVHVSLKGLKVLKDLDLSFNNFTEIPSDMFLDNKLLVTLNLGWNKIVNVTKQPFKSTTNILSLNLSNNGPDLSLPLGFLEGLQKLVNLTISDCHMTKPPADLLNYTKALTLLELGNNRITEFPDGFFQNANDLISLELSFNDLTNNVSADTFQGLRNLKTLGLRKNNFTDFPDSILKAVPNLDKLFLEENFLEELNMDGQSVLFLEELTLTMNRISKLDKGLPFGDRSGLKKIILRGNNLTDFSAYMIAYNFVSELDLSSNHFPVLTLPVLYSQSNLIVKFIGCSIQTVDCSLLDTSPNPKNGQYTRYILEDNPFVCDCEQLQFQNCLNSKSSNFPERMNLKCTTVKDSTQRNIIDVDPKDFICKREPCPKDCFCFQTAEKDIVVDCQGKSFSKLPSPQVLPQGFKVLQFQGNNLTTIMDLRDQAWENVTEFYADNNKIQSDNWVLPNSLKVLSLTNNNLRWFPKCLESFVQQANKINLGQNPWECNCSALDFHNKVWASLSKLDSESITCATPDKLKDQKISSWDTKSLCPSRNSNVVSIVIPVLICTLVAVVALLTVTFYFRNRRTIMAYLYTHWHKIFMLLYSKEDLDEERHFHAFVAYNSSDRHIIRSLLEELEKKPPYYRLCIHERDWLPGQLIAWNIVQSVQNSRRTILVLSKEFLKSMWFQVEYSVAYHHTLEDKVDRLIIIVNGELPDSTEMDKELQLLMSTKTYLIWEERWFWEKLKYALPHQNNRTSMLPPKEKPNSEVVQRIKKQVLDKLQSENPNAQSHSPNTENQRNALLMSRQDKNSSSVQDSKV